MSPNLCAHKVRDLPALTGARFVAAVGVMLCHFGPMAGWPLWLSAHGREAVAFFFVLSGFVLTYNYAGRLPTSDRDAYRQFLRARFARIYPVHIIVLVMSTLVLWYFARQDPSQGPGISGIHVVISWLQVVFLVQSYTTNAVSVVYWSGPAWSISCEATFYLVFPLLLWNMRRLRTSRAAAWATLGCWGATGLWVLSACVIARVFLHKHDNGMDFMIYHAPYLRVGEFATGCFAGFWFVQRGERPWESRWSREAAVWGSLVVTMTIAILTNYEKVPLIYSETVAFTGPFALMIVALASGPTLLGDFMSGRVIGRLGEASYSLYLIHALPFIAMSRICGIHTSSLNVLIGLLISVLASLAMYHWVEEPCRQLLRKAPQSRPAKPTVQAGLAGVGGLMPLAAG